MLSTSLGATLENVYPKNLLFFRKHICLKNVNKSSFPTEVNRFQVLPFILYLPTNYLELVVSCIKIYFRNNENTEKLRIIRKERNCEN